MIGEGVPMLLGPHGNVKVRGEAIRMQPLGVDEIAVVVCQINTCDRYGLFEQI